MPGYGKRKRSTKKYSSKKKFKGSSARSRSLVRPYSKSKSSYRSSKGSKLSAKPRKAGTHHWLSFGKGLHNKKRIGFLKKLEKVLPPNHSMYQSVNQLVAAAGVQAYSLLSTAYDSYDIKTYNGGTGSVQGKVILKHGQSVINLTNQSNAPCFIDLYETVARRDMTANGTAIDPTYWMAHDAVSTGSTYYGYSPFDNESVCTRFKVVRITRLNLSVGETAEHVITYTPQRVWNHVLDSTNLDGIPGSNEGHFKGLTYNCFAIFKGCAVDNDNTTIASAGTCIDSITVTRYTYELVTTSSGAYIQTATALDTTAPDHIMNAASGVDAAITKA